MALKQPDGFEINSSTTSYPAVTVHYIAKLASFTKKDDGIQ